MALFPIPQSINYNYIKRFLENCFTCQVTITIALRIIYAIISWTMVCSERAKAEKASCGGGNGHPLRFQARKMSTKINFLGPETARWDGGLPREGVGVE